MTTIATGQLTDAARALIDARLDTIDRMLLGRVSRADRLSIVREVEAQVHELIAESDAEELDREAALAVLARLDPPEAYLPEETSGGPVVTVRFGPRRAAEPARAAAIPQGSTGYSRASGILGIVALSVFLLALLVYLVLLTGNMGDLAIVVLFASLGLLLLSFLCGLMALILGIVGRHQGVWAIVGSITGGIAMFVSLMGAGIAILLG